jgi:predicted RNase H-like nuclease (RuvC/YqgF family)
MDGLSEILTPVGALTTAAIALGTFLCTRGVDALIKMRSDKREDRKLEREIEVEDESIAIGVYKDMIRELTTRVTTLEQQLLTLQTANIEHLNKAHAVHLDCVKEQEQLRGEVNVLREQVERLKSHDTANQEHKKGLERVVQKLEEKMESKSGPMPVVKNDSTRDKP